MESRYRSDQVKKLVMVKEESQWSHGRFVFLLPSRLLCPIKGVEAGSIVHFPTGCFQSHSHIVVTRQDCVIDVIVIDRKRGVYSRKSRRE